MFKSFGNFLLTIIGGTIFLIFTINGWLVLTSARAQTLPPLQNGDIIFQTSQSDQSNAIMLATGSFYTHMGIIKIAESGEPVVIEAAGPVRETPLDVWIKSGWGGRTTIKRVKNLPVEFQNAVVKAAKKYYGKPYDIYFSFENEAIYCSELVYNAYDALGIKLGETQRLRELNVLGAAAENLIRERGMEHPLCREGKAATYNMCVDRVMSAPLITPVSISRDPKLETVYTNYLAAKG
jgi:hypothetical protein